MTLVLLAFVLLPFGTEQTASGTVSGAVTDVSARGVPGASIRLVQVATGFERSVSAGDDGTFFISSLTAGEYRVTVTAPGLATAERLAQVEVGTTTRVDFELAIGTVMTAITVSGALPLVRADHHQIGGVVGRDQIETLPLNGRDFLELSRLEPGVTAPVRGTNHRTFVSVLGSGLQTAPRVGATRVTIDGANVNFIGAIGASLKLSPDAVQEFQLASASFEVATSLAAAGAVNVVTRSGGNTPAGGLLLLYRDHTLSAYPALRRDPSNPDPLFRRHHESGWFSGPLRRGRAFVFANLEHQQQSSVVSVQPATPEFGALGGLFPSRARSTQVTVRADARLRSQQQLFARYSHDRSRSFAPLNERVDLLPSAWTVLRHTTGQAVVGLTAVRGSRLVGELRVSHLRITSPERPADAAGCPGCFGVGLPRTSVQGVDLAFGDARTLDFEGDRFQTTLHLTWQRSSHTIRLTGDWEHGSTKAAIEAPQSASIVLWAPQRVRDLNPAIPLPSTYRSVADVLQLPVQSYSAAVAGAVLERGFNPRRVFDQYRLAASDTWRLGARVTVNAGAGWAYEPNALNHDLSKPALLVDLLGAERLHPPRVERDRFSAVAGVAWNVTPGGRTIVHAGAGRYFDPASSTNQVNLVMERQALSPLGTRLSLPAQRFARPTSTTGADAVALVPQLWADLRARLRPDNRDLTFRNIDATKTARSLSDPAFSVPYAIHVNAGVQRELTRTLAARVDVVWRDFHRTFLTDIDYNRWDSASSVLPRCEGNEMNDVMAVCSNGVITFDATAGRARYRGLLVRVDKRMASGLQLLGSYALGRFTGTNGTGAGSGFDLRNWYANDGPLPTDRRHVVNLSGRLELPHALQFSWNAAFHSRAPMSVFLTDLDFDGDGTRNDLLPGTTVNQFRHERDQAVLARLVAQYNDTWARQRLCCNQGSAPPVTLPADYSFDDRFFTVDIRLARTWRLNRSRVSVFADIFNIFNTANLVPVSGNILNPASFGQASARGSHVFGSGGPRAIQFGSRVGL